MFTVLIRYRKLFAQNYKPGAIDEARAMREVIHVGPAGMLNVPGAAAV